MMLLPPPSPDLAMSMSMGDLSHSSRALPTRVGTCVMGVPPSSSPSTKGNNGNGLYFGPLLSPPKHSSRPRSASMGVMLSSLF